MKQQVQTIVHYSDESYNTNKVMNCTINDLNLSFDKDNRLRSTIGRVSGWNVDKATMLAAQLQSDDFKKFLSKNLTDNDILTDATVDINNIQNSDYVNIKQNKFGSLLNYYYLTHYHSVDSTKTNKGMGRLLGFSSSNAKKVAKEYVGDLIIGRYQSELNKPREVRKTNGDIINEVRKELNDTFIKRADNFADNILVTDKYSQEAKDYAQRYKDTIKRGKTLAAEINRNNPWLSSTKSLIDEFEKKERNAAEEKQYQELKKNYKEIGKAQNQRREAIARIKQDRKIMAYNLMTLFTSNEDAAVGVRNRNFANLVMQVNGNPNEFFFEVYNTKKMTNLIKEYNKTGDISEYIEDEDINNDDQDNQFNNQTIDETSKSWEDNLYKNFNTAVSTKMKFMLSRIPKLAAPFSSTSNAQAADTNNELGVPLYYDSGYLTLQIFANADFTNIDNMISSLERKSNQIKALYGLGSFINRLKQDRTLANYVYANFAKPIVNKVMTTINDVKVADGIVFDYSNPNAFGQVKLAFDMMNKLRATYNSQYNTKDSETLERLGRTKDEDINNIRKEFAKVLTTYFPNFDTTTLDNIFNLSNREEVVRSLIRNLKSIVDDVGKIKDNINAEYDRINKKYIDECNKYNDKVAELYKKKVPQHLYPEPPVKDEFDVSKYNLSGTVNQAIIRFANTISEYNESRARLNTANAEGNTASDVIKNCFITRFFDMILSENENDSNAGLKALRDYLLQGTENGKDNQYSNNPIFFGLKDQYGNAVAGAEGMFTKTPNGAIINPNAKSILKYALFDGVKNANSGIGTVYDKMSKIEFFITQYIAFNNSLEERTENGTTKNVGNLKTAVYPMRIGSDAPKIFMIRAPRYSRTQVEYALFNHFMNEMTMFVKGINNLFTIKDGNFVTKTDVDGLIGRAYFNEKTANKIRNSGGADYTKAIVEDGKLAGKMFKFYRLFQLNGYDFNKQLEDALSLYGGGREGRPALFATTADGKIMLNNDYLKRPESFLVVDGDKVRLNLNNAQRDYFMDMVHTWATTYLNESKVEISDYLEALDEQGIHYDDASIDSFLLNSAVMNMNYDDLFEGDFKFYNNPRDFLKRTKETQAGGDAYENSNMLDWKNDITELEWNGQPATINIKQTRGGEAVPYVTPTYRNGIIENDAPMVSRNGWRAVTIYNTIKPADEAQQLQEVLYKQFISEGMDEARAHARSVKIAKGYWDNTTANDAQSYITLEEFIRRKEADGTLDEYQDLLAQLLDPNISANELDLDEINARIQVQKNFYFDKVFDADTGQFIPRQIKNAEFVLIPKLLPKDSDLIKVYNWMKANDIGQLNTAETDKAAKKNIFTIWNDVVENGKHKVVFIDPNTNSEFNDSYIQNYKYKYLYKQQDVPQHMTNEENKLGSQISKKIIDNVSTASKQVQDWADEYQAGYVANIREDFLNFLDSMGWELDASGKIVNSEYATIDVDGNPLNAETIRSNRETLNLTNYYTRARQEAVRLGMDSNFIEYLIPDEFGKPIMPNAMNNVQQKLESVGQALFNRTITRQTLPGWHAAQITGIGYSKTLEFDAKSGVMQVYLPRWSNLIPKGKTPEEDAAILKQIQEAGLDIHLGYRIPTEGKQSISVLRVVGFTNEALGSTIVVPDAWVTQTGSDFDVDSIYGICWEIYRKKEKNGTYAVHKIPYKEEETDDRMLYINYVNSCLDNKVKRTDLGEEIDSTVKELKARIRGEQREEKEKRENLAKLFDEQDAIRNEIYRKRLPAWARGIIKDENAAAKRKAKADGIVVDLTDAYPNIADKLTEYLNNHTLSEEEVNAVQDYLDQQTTLLNIIDAQRGSYRFNKEDYFNEKNAAIQQAIEDNINAWVKNVEAEAAKVGIISFEEFKSLPYVERLNRRARNNYILERMINIMNDVSSREEQYGRSQFESIVNGEDGANDIVDKIAGTTTKLISPYNPLTQLDYFDDAMGGAALKARSVNWDTMASKSNRAHGYLSDDNVVYAVLNVDGESAPDSAITYDEQTIKDAYGDDIKFYTNNDKVIEENGIIEDTETDKKQLLLKANKFGWSNNNKNVVNDYVTTSTAQTTAHHLDAVKRGSIPNVNNYTFDVYKLITCLGLDHEFSVGFMRQPIISRLVANYNLTNSIYFKDSNDPIDMTVADIAKDLNLQYVTETKYGTRANPINKHSNLNESVDALKKDENFVAAFKSIFGVDISNMSGNNIFALKIPLRKDYIFQRIRTAGRNKTNKINLEHSTAYNEAAVDFATLIQFRQMLATTKKINTIIQFSAVDKIGAKPSNRETRQIRDSINRFRGDTVLMVGNKTWANALFPLDEDGNVDVNASVNPPIAASYAYSTLPSIQVAGQVFVTEQQDYIDAENNIQKIIGRRFTEQEAKEWRRYGMTYLYNGIGKLLEPLMVDERGRIIPFISKTEENGTEPKTANLYWNDERSRIVGYGVTSESNFTVENINDPTGPELAEYAKLTPAQKVIFIQRNFPDNQSIFNYIKVTLINNTDAKNKGITRQYLSYDDQVDSIEDLFHFFRNSFSNHNPLIKLACVDLIKYAFIAEGFNFRSGYITKTIPNDTLYTDINQGGMDIINNIDLAHPDNNGVVEKLRTLPAQLVSEEFIDLFIRSHSELIKTIRIPNAEYKTDRDTGEAVEKNSWSKMFKLCTRPDGLVLLDNTTQNPTLRGLINKLNLKNKVNGYVKVDFPIDQTHRDTRLYLVVAGNEFNILNDKKQVIGTDYKDYYLVPLNLLEKYETYDMSYNERYNKFNNFNYYLDICEKLETATESRRRAKSNAVVTEANRMVAGVKQQVGTYRPSTGGVQDTMKVITALTAMTNSADEKLAAGARMLTNPISRIMVPRVLADNYNAMYILNNNRIFAQYIPQGTSTTQVILDADGNAQEFTIASIPANHTARKAVKEMIDDVTKIDTKDRQDEYQYIVDQCEDTKTSPFGSIIYRVSPVKKTNEEVSDTIMQAATVTIDPVEDDTVDRADIVGNSARRGMDIDNVSAAIIKQITYDARKNDRDIAVDFVRNLERRGINRNFRSNLIEHRGDIYTAAARYYQSAANAIINRINKYNLLGEDYDMSEEAMYEVLAQNPEYFADVANLILDAVTFGNRIDMIFSLDIATEDKQTKEAVESIMRSINSIRTNTKVRMAMNNLINIYFKRYSTNPMITQGLMNIRDQFGDIDTAVKLIADPAEINNNEVQIILKQIYTMFSQAEMFETRRNVKEWKDAVDEINKMTGNLDMKNVIDFDNFKLRDDFNEDFYKDKTKVIDDYKEAKQHRFDSIDAYDKYLQAQYARDEFMYKYTEQPIISDYYKEDLNNRQRAMERGGKLYSEYRMLSAMLYEQKDILEDNEIEIIKARIRELKSITDVVGAEKAPHLKMAAEAINDYIDKRRDITNKYFNKQEYDGFQETYQRYNSFIKSYDKHHSEETLDEKLENAEYREAYEWIKNNGHVAFTQEASDKLSDAFQKLVERKSAISTKTKIRLKAVEGAIDESGTINPMALSDEQIRLLKEEEETELSTKYTNGDGEMILIKDVPKGIPLRFRKKKAIKYKQDPDKARTIGRINQIISKTVNHDTGKIDIPTLFNNEYVTDAEREELARLYEHLYARGVGFEDDQGVSYSLEYNRDAYNAAMNYYNTNLRNTKQGKQFLRIVTHMTVDGQLLPNTYMYGYKLPFEEFVDQERTDAFNFIQDNVEFVPTEYYYQALKKASEEGRYDEWFELNHVYNPFSHKFEPLKIWTRMQAKPNSELAKSVEYIPSFDNMERSIKEEYINKNYKEFGANYKKGNSKYDSTVKRNAKEEAMYKLIQQTLNKYASTYQGKRFVGQGYLPRERETQVNGRWALGQIAALFGASWHSGADSDSFHETVDYSHDREAEMKMLQLLKDKGSKKYKKLPNRADFKTDEEYQKELEKIRKENTKIAEDNRNIDKGLVNKDVLKVIEDFVYNVTIFNSRQAAKPYLYLLLEDLAVNNAYMIKGMWNKHLVKDLDTSTRDDTQYRRVQQTNARELVHNLARRLIYSQYHDTGALRTVANFMQNFTSAKFMIFNLYGGVANVATGKINIAMEEFANEYFGFKEMHKAERMYLSNSAAFVASMFTEKSPNLTVALCKQFKVVDFDQVLQFGATSDNLDARMRTVRNFMYSFQSMGEHYMQNSVALAMLESNRLYTDSEGNIRIGDFKDFTWDVESRAMHDVLAAYPDLLMGYKAYKESIAKYSIEQRLELSMGHKDLNRNFLYSLRDNIDENVNALYKKIATAYQKRREELMKEAKQEFVTNPTIHSLYEFKNGEAVLTAEAIAKLKGKAKDPERELETLIAGLREKIKAVNKKIHGVYDKNGAALIESKWWGSLVMQYHKHLPMGIWKRWRRKGYYSEFRGSMERGTYQTFLDFIGTEFTNFKTRRGQKQENGTGIALASIQVTMESLLNSFVNIQFNWNNLSNWERANIRRNIAEIAGVLTACLVVFALYGLSDDDDINDDRFKASLLYLADRLYSETTTYSPVGIISEYRTNLRNPIAAMQSVTDLMKAAVMIPQYLFDPSFEVEYQNGRYAGENKFEVLLKRNTAGFRNFDRIMTIDKNNSYYKVGKSQIGINVAKSFGDIVAGRDND